MDGLYGRGGGDSNPGNALHMEAAMTVAHPLILVY